MKKIIIISLFFMGIFSQNCFGQLKVDSVGHVGIQANKTKSPLTVGGYGFDDYTAYISSMEGRNGLVILNKQTLYSHSGLVISNYPSGNSRSFGIRVIPTESSPTSGTTHGIYCKGGGSTTRNLGVLGCVKNASNALCVGVFGSGSTSGADYITDTGAFAGYFLGDVKVTGALTASSLVTPSLTSLQPNSNESNTVRAFSAPDLVCERMNSIGLLEMHVETIGTKDSQNTLSSKILLKGTLK